MAGNSHKRCILGENCPASVRSGGSGERPASAVLPSFFCLFNSFKKDKLWEKRRGPDRSPILLFLMLWNCGGLCWAALPVTGAAAGRPEAPGWPGPRRRKLRIIRFRAGAKAHSLRCASSPHAAYAARGPRWDGHAVPGPGRLCSLFSVYLTAAAAARPEVPDWPGPAWPGQTGSGCCSWCNPSFPQPHRYRGWWTRRSGCSLP